MYGFQFLIEQSAAEINTQSNKFTENYEIITPTNAPKKKYIIVFLKVSYMFRRCWAIFRENNIDTLWLRLYS
jgi:hypothetical protein